MCRVNYPHIGASSLPASCIGPVTRRTLLRGCLVLGVSVAAVSAVAACDSRPTQAQVTAEALLPLALAARSEFTAARTLAPQTPEYTAALGVLGDQREQHAQSLREEITRLDFDIADRLDTPSAGDTSAQRSDGEAPSPSAPTMEIGTIDELRDALTRSQRAAAEAAITLQGYSSGLAGAIAASLATMTEVHLG